jgi:hypothetical protein
MFYKKWLTNLLFFFGLSLLRKDTVSSLTQTNSVRKYITSLEGQKAICII